MTIREIIDYADALKPNAFTDAHKVQWLNELEGKAQALVLHVPEGELVQYTLPVDEATVPLIPFPHDKVYGLWLCAMVDYANGEYDKYANTAAMANDAYDTWAKARMRDVGPGRAQAAFKNW